jgi:hypothetical protein
VTISPLVYLTDLSILRRSHPARLGRASILPVNSMVLAAHLSNPWWQKSHKLSLSAPLFPTRSRMSNGACNSAARAARQCPFHFPVFPRFFSSVRVYVMSPQFYRKYYKLSFMPKKHVLSASDRKDIFGLATLLASSATLSASEDFSSPREVLRRSGRTHN